MMGSSKLCPAATSGVADATRVAAGNGASQTKAGVRRIRAAKVPLPRSKPWLSGQVANVLDLAGDPARDVVGPHYIAGPGVAAPLLIDAHDDALIHGGGGGLDVEWVDREHMWMQLFIGTDVLGEDDHPI